MSSVPPRRPFANDLPVIDELRLVSEFGDAPEILAELRDHFLQHIPPLVDAISRACEAGDTPSLARSAHSLKGACSTYGAPRLTAVCQEIERLGRAGDVAAAVVLLPCLREEIDQVIDCLGAIRVS